MDTIGVIQKKRDGAELTANELEHMIAGFTSGAVPDYQMSAWLMAVLLRGMSDDETYEMTRLMMRSGRALSPAELPLPSADKHSTGGVGDKVSLALAPLVASAGVCVPMLSGRGLGHTGGTLDKLESIKGLRTKLSVEEFMKQVETIGCCIASQSDGMNPADGKIYALRDVTGTVESLPLIVSSIVSKKVAEGAGSLVYDVKWGGGAFMSEMESALELASRLVRETERFDRKAVAFVTDMNQPLGAAVGNSLEVIEAIDLLKGEGPSDLEEITLLLGGAMLDLAGAAAGVSAGAKVLRASIESGAALSKLKEMIRAQGGDDSVVEDTSVLHVSENVVDVVSNEEGYVSLIAAKKLGALVCEMGGGRRRVGDTIDHGVGAVLLKKVGDHVAAGEPLLRLHASDRVKAKDLTGWSRTLFEISPASQESRPLVSWVVTARGQTSWDDSAIQAL